jgi:hypothetical protein
MRNLAARWGALALCLALTTAAPAWGKPPKEKEPEAEKSYVMPYFLVILSTAFGVMVVCRPGKRLDKERLPVRDESEE